MADNEKKCCEFFSSLKYTNLLLTIIVMLFIAGVLCKHLCMDRKHLYWKGGKDMMGGKGMIECPVTSTQMPATK